MKHKLNLILIVVLLLTNSLLAQKSVEIKVWAAQLEKGTASPVYEVNTEKAVGKVEWKNRIFLQPDVTFQKIEGIGGAFNEIGGQALLSLSAEKQQEVMKDMFSMDKAGFTFCRTAIGASDFGLDAYSYSMVADDYQMKHFSIERDQKFVLPFIKSALNINPALTVFASPWSPPGWMKETGEMVGLKEKPNRLKDEPKIYQAYAKYFVKYVQEYQKNGVSIDRICIQNENDADTKYPSCIFPAKEMVSFANNYLIPAFKKNKVATKIYGGTYRAVDKMDLIDFVTCPNTKKLDGVGVQYTDARILADAKLLQPNLKLFHTEGNCYNGENSTVQAMSRLEEVASYINNGCTAFTYWNMILNETTKSGWDWPQNSLININRETGEVRYNPDYNAMYIISQFVKPGDVRIASFNKGKYPMITVKSPDGVVKVLIQNTNADEKTFLIALENREIHVNIPARAITAIIIED